MAWIFAGIFSVPQEVIHYLLWICRVGEKVNYDLWINGHWTELRMLNGLCKGWLVVTGDIPASQLPEWLKPANANIILKLHTWLSFQCKYMILISGIWLCSYAVSVQIGLYLSHPKLVVSDFFIFWIFQYHILKSVDVLWRTWGDA